LKQQFELIKQTVLQLKGTIIKDNKEWKTQFESLKKELVETTGLLNSIQEIAIHNNMKIIEMGLIIDPLQGGALEGGALEGGALEGDALEGDALEGDALEGGALEGGTLEGGTLEGGALEGGALEGGALEGGALEGDALKLLVENEINA